MWTCCVYKPRLLFEGGVYFVQELRIVRLQFEGGDYSRAVSNSKKYSTYTLYMSVMYVSDYCHVYNVCSIAGVDQIIYENEQLLTEK